MMTQLLQTVTRSHEITGEELQFLLSSRDKRKVNFWLIDVREIIEYSALSIRGTDYLFPSSTLHLHLDEVSKLQDRLIIFYCKSASRTFQLIHALKRMGFHKIAHLDSGIMEYHGETLKNAPLPHNIRK